MISLLGLLDFPGGGIGAGLLDPYLRGLSTTPSVPWLGRWLCSPEIFFPADGDCPGPAPTGVGPTLDPLVRLLLVLLLDQTTLVALAPGLLSLLTWGLIAPSPWVAGSFDGTTKRRRLQSFRVGRGFRRRPGFRSSFERALLVLTRWAAWKELDSPKNEE